MQKYETPNLAESTAKKVWLQTDLEHHSLQIGDYVENAVVSDLMDLLPPVCLREDCSQVGEPYSHRCDPTSGKWRATFTTFKKVAGTGAKSIWEYCGHCFNGENEERGIDPAYH